MCLAIPGKVEEILTEGDLRVGVVNFGGVRKRVCLDYVPEVAVGDYTIVHVWLCASRRLMKRRLCRRWRTSARWACWTRSWRARKRLLARAAERPQSRLSRWKLPERDSESANQLNSLW